MKHSLFKDECETRATVGNLCKANNAERFLEIHFCLCVKGLFGSFQSVTVDIVAANFSVREVLSVPF